MQIWDWIPPLLLQKKPQKTPKLVQRFKNYQFLNHRGKNPTAEVKALMEINPVRVNLNIRKLWGDPGSPGVLFWDDTNASWQLLGVNI